MQINKDLLNTALNQMWKIISGPLVLLFIPLYLTEIEQGYWYSFISIAALSIFADLGFSVIILQFAAHEFAYLQFDKNGIIRGDTKHLERLATFFSFSVKWLIKVVMIIFPVIVVGGYIFLSYRQEHILWQVPWLIYSSFSGMLFFYSSILYFFEGCNSVKDVQMIRLKIAVCTSITILVGLYFRISLFALALSLVVSNIVGIYSLHKKFAPAIKQLWDLSKDTFYNWKKEFFSLIWRYAISWSSGYFIFQLFVPLTFRYHSSADAGRVGISIAMWTAGFGIANTWLVAITPKLNMLIAEKKWSDLDALFNKNLYRALGTMILGGSIYFLVYGFGLGRYKIFERFETWIPMMMLFACWILQLYINSLALYLRAHKKEPMMMLSAISAVYIAISTYLCAKYLTQDFLFLGFLSSYFFGVPVTLYLYKIQKNDHYARGI
jgi:hypothetical protein